MNTLFSNQKKERWREVPVLKKKISSHTRCSPVVSVEASDYKQTKMKKEEENKQASKQRHNCYGNRGWILLSPPSHSSLRARAKHPARSYHGENPEIGNLSIFRILTSNLVSKVLY
jgi:hypothetical protein